MVRISEAVTYRRRSDDLPEYVSRGEAELLIDQRVRAEEERMAAHQRQHEQQEDALKLAFLSEQKQQSTHNVAHDNAHVSHAEKHADESLAVQTALASVDRERKIHSEAHDREHSAHMREHEMANLAISKAEAATDQRFIATNGYREQLSGMVTGLASRESVDVLIKDVDRRFEESRKDRERRHEELRLAITLLERSDQKAEGRGIGQNALIAYTVAGLSIIGSLIVLSNLLITPA